MYEDRARQEARRGAERTAESVGSVAATVEMLDAFASVGVTAFDLTITPLVREKVSFRRGVSGQELNQSLPDMLERCHAHHRNIIVRPKPPPALLQLDDIDADRRRLMETVSFLSLETSHGNFQSWIAFEDTPSAEFMRCVSMALGADPNASGATRIAGSFNFKPKYAPNYPLVRIAHVHSGRMATERDLIDQGVVPAFAALRHPVQYRSRQAVCRAWPDYSRCLGAAPLNNDQTKVDVSRADFTYCLIALDWGWSIEEVALRLMAESQKARKFGCRYADLTARRAAIALAERRSTGSR